MSTDAYCVPRSDFKGEVVRAIRWTPKEKDTADIVSFLNSTKVKCANHSVSGDTLTLQLGNGSTVTMKPMNFLLLQKNGMTKVLPREQFLKEYIRKSEAARQGGTSAPARRSRADMLKNRSSFNGQIKITGLVPLDEALQVINKISLKEQEKASKVISEKDMQLYMSILTSAARKGGESAGIAMIEQRPNMVAASDLAAVISTNILYQMAALQHKMKAAGENPADSKAMRDAIVETGYKLERGLIALGRSKGRSIQRTAGSMAGAATQPRAGRRGTAGGAASQDKAASSADYPGFEKSEKYIGITPGDNNTINVTVPMSYLYYRSDNAGFDYEEGNAETVKEVLGYLTDISSMGKATEVDGSKVAAISMTLPNNEANRSRWHKFLYDYHPDLAKNASVMLDSDTKMTVCVTDQREGQGLIKSLSPVKATASGTSKIYISFNLQKDGGEENNSKISDVLGNICNAKNLDSVSGDPVELVKKLVWGLNHVLENKGNSAGNGGKRRGTPKAPPIASAPDLADESASASPMAAPIAAPAPTPAPAPKAAPVPAAGDGLISKEKEIRDMDQRDRKELAGKTDTSVETLAILAGDEDWTIREIVAKNPNTPTEVLDILTSDDRWRVRLEVASSANASIETLATLATDTNDGVRLEVARNPITPADILTVCSRDDDADIRRSASLHPNIPIDIITTLATDKDARVREGAASNEKTPAILLEQLSKDGDGNVRFGVAANPNTTSEILDNLSKDKDSIVRRWVAMNSNTSPETLIFLSNDKDNQVSRRAKSRISGSL